MSHKIYYVKLSKCEVSWLYAYLLGLQPLACLFYHLSVVIFVLMVMHEDINRVLFAGSLIVNLKL